MFLPAQLMGRGRSRSSQQHDIGVFIPSIISIFRRHWSEALKGKNSPGSGTRLMSAPGNY